MNLFHCILNSLPLFGYFHPEFLNVENASGDTESDEIKQKEQKLGNDSKSKHNETQTTGTERCPVSNVPVRTIELLQKLWCCMT